MRNRVLPERLKVHCLLILFITMQIAVTVRISAQTQNLPHAITAIAWSPDGSMIAIGGYPDSAINQVLIVDVHSGQIEQQLDVHTATFPSPGAVPEIVPGSDIVSTLAWSPDGTRIAAGTIGAILMQMWDVQSGQLILTYPLILGGGQSGAGAYWSPDGTQLAIASPVAVHIVDTSTSETITSFDRNGNNAAWSPDGTRIASGGAFESAVWIWDANTGQELLTLEGNIGIEAVDWSPDGNKLASVDGGDNTVSIWDVTNGQLLMKITSFSGPVRDVSWNPDSTRLATGDNNGNIQIWDGISGIELNLIETGKQIFEVEWSPDGTQLTYAGGILQPDDKPIPILEFPTAHAGDDQTVTDADGSSSETITLDGSGSGDPDGTIDRYVWTENGVEIATGVSPQVDLAVGRHVITLTVTDDDGATSSDEIRVTIEAE